MLFVVIKMRNSLLMDKNQEGGELGS